MSDRDAEQCDTPVFKKRNRGAKGLSVSVLNDEKTSSESSEQNESRYVLFLRSLGVDELIAMRNLLKKPTGIELSQLNKGTVAKDSCRSTSKENPGSSGSAIHRLVHKNNFQAESATVHIDKHMYVLSLTWDGLYRVRNA